MPLEDQQQLPADMAAIPAKRVIHPDPLTADVNPAAPFQIGQVPRHGGLGEPKHSHKIADAELPFGLEQQDDPEPDRIG